MTPNNLLLFTARPSLGDHRMRARPAKVIPLCAHRHSHDRFHTNLLFAMAAILVWGGAIVLGLVNIRFSHAWTYDLFPGWQGWPVW